MQLGGGGDGFTCYMQYILYIYIHICICIYIYIYEYAYMYIYTCIRVCALCFSVSIMCILHITYCFNLIHSSVLLDAALSAVTPPGPWLRNSLT